MADAAALDDEWDPPDVSGAIALKDIQIAEVETAKREIGKDLHRLRDKLREKVCWVDLNTTVRLTITLYCDAGSLGGATGSSAVIDAERRR